MYDENVSRSDVDYIAQEAARQARYDAERYIDEQLAQMRNDLHESFVDLRIGLGELAEELKQLREDFNVHNTHGTGQK